MKFVEFLIIFPSIYQVKFFVASQKSKDSSENQFDNYETILNSLETFSSCLSMDEFQNFDILNTIQLCSGLSTIAKVRFLTDFYKHFWSKILGFYWKFNSTTAAKVETLSITTPRFEQMWFCLSKTINTSEISWYQKGRRQRSQSKTEPNKNFVKTDDAKWWRVSRFGSMFWNMSKVSHKYLLFHFNISEKSRFLDAKILKSHFVRRQNIPTWRWLLLENIWNLKI